MTTFSNFTMIENAFAPNEIPNNTLGEKVAQASRTIADGTYTLVDVHKINFIAQAAEADPQAAVNFLKQLAAANAVVFDGATAETAVRADLVRNAQDAQTLRMVHDHVNDVAQNDSGNIAELLGVEWIDEEEITGREYEALHIMGYTDYEIEDMDGATYAQKLAEAAEAVPRMSDAEASRRLHATREREEQQEAC